ncbi:unnamed protein product [Vitrella brassicaformis CCMP3155]|uniref:Uncharacterized protein n=1 Tax=Vitrella brassicaformis (strain CCMP3155) TaxID=1169540 RepID=A0A0G4EPZ2_VITBC|nr:unnamed protein product [Vitrella brassicaformis CCMP3155]|eukprot:CEL99925.1 unnamed protein product [Vitrella brassicaformis CCMP3155]
MPSGSLLVDALQFGEEYTASDGNYLELMYNVLLLILLMVGSYWAERRSGSLPFFQRLVWTTTLIGIVGTVAAVGYSVLWTCKRGPLRQARANFVQRVVDDMHITSHAIVSFLQGGHRQPLPSLPSFREHGDGTALDRSMAPSSRVDEPLPREVYLKAAVNRLHRVDLKAINDAHQVIAVEILPFIELLDSQSRRPGMPGDSRHARRRTRRIFLAEFDHVYDHLLKTAGHLNRPADTSGNLARDLPRRRSRSFSERAADDGQDDDSNNAESDVPAPSRPDEGMAPPCEPPAAASLPWTTGDTKLDPTRLRRGSFASCSTISDFYQLEAAKKDGRPPQHRKADIRREDTHGFVRDTMWLERKCSPLLWPAEPSQTHPARSDRVRASSARPQQQLEGDDAIEGISVSSGGSHDSLSC